MTISQYKQLHRDLRIYIPRKPDYNPLPSETDPTQDIPIRMIEVNSLGEPINVKQRKPVYSGVSADNLTTIEKRNCDQFDNVGELQESIKKVSTRGITTDFVKPKKVKQNEKQENN